MNKFAPDFLLKQSKMIFLILFFGFLFGAILQYARLNKFDVISGMATLEDLTVAKAIAVAVGVGIILLNIEIGAGMATYHIKPFLVGGIILGGLIFGAGMAILGYCPGTSFVSLGEGALDALVGIIGGLFGGFVFTLVLPVIQPVLGPDLGKISLYSLTGGGSLFYVLAFIIGIVFIWLGFWMNKKEKGKSFEWLYAGAGLAVLNGFVFLTIATNRPIGASTSFPYMADVLTGFTGNDYFKKIATPGHWEMIFLIGATVAGFIFSISKMEFKLGLMHDNWIKYKGTSKTKRIIWAFIGGFILIFGARMAGGCTSGHIISGGMQVSVSSLVFAVFVFAGLLGTGKLFYKKQA